MTPAPALAAVFAAAALPLFAVPPPNAKPASAGDPVQKLEMFEEAASCVETRVETNDSGATIFVRNTCPIRVNVAVCVRRPEDKAASVTHGSLSESAVYDVDVAMKGKAREFKKGVTFCPGITCQVTEPEC